jgi:ammonia channel protein AmtB
MGVLDFAGGLVVHLSAGIGGLVAATVMGGVRAMAARTSRRSTCRLP